MTARRSGGTFDFTVPAELFPCRAQRGRRSTSYKRFSTTAEAVLFAIEEMPPLLLPGTYLEVDETRFDSSAIRELYARSDFPLTRAMDKKTAQAAGDRKT